MGGVNRAQNWPFQHTQLLGLLISSRPQSTCYLFVQQIFIADINGSLSGCIAAVFRKLYHQTFHTKQNKTPEQKTLKTSQTVKTRYFMFDGRIIKPKPMNVSIKAARRQ